MRCVLVLTAIAISSSPALADEFFKKNGLFVAGGPLLGGSIHDDANGLLLGSELSAGWVHVSTPEASPFWLGAYADGLYDTGPDTGRVSVGPELGYFIAGLDAGLVHELGGAGRWGFQGRVSFSIPVMYSSPEKRPRLESITTLSLYFRAVTWRDESAGHGEIGLLVKWLLPGLVSW